MATSIFDVVRLLESKRLSFYIQRNSPYDLTITAVLVGKRVEIRVGEDGLVDVAAFTGDEQVEVGMDAVETALQED